MERTLNPEQRALADAWWAERTGGGSEAWYRLQSLARSDPEAAWGVLSILVERLGDGSGAPAARTPDDILRVHVASVLGDILEAAGETFAPRVIAGAAANPQLRSLLARLIVSEDAAARPTLEQLRSASGGRLRIAPAPGSELGRVAFAVADEYRAGRLSGVPPGERFPVPYLATEIARRLPGRRREDYEVAAERGLHWSR